MLLILGLLLLTILLWGVWGLLAKLGVSLMNKYQFVLLSTIVSFVTTLLVLGLLGKLQLSIPQHWEIPVTAGVIGGVTSVTLYIILERMEASRAIPMLELYIVVTFLLSVWLLKEALTLTKVLGVIFAVLALILLAI